MLTNQTFIKIFWISLYSITIATTIQLVKLFIFKVSTSYITILFWLLFGGIGGGILFSIVKKNKREASRIMLIYLGVLALFLFLSNIIVRYIISQTSFEVFFP